MNTEIANCIFNIMQTNDRYRDLSQEARNSYSTMFADLCELRNIELGKVPDEFNNMASTVNNGSLPDVVIKDPAKFAAIVQGGNATITDLLNDATLVYKPSGTDDQLPSVTEVPDDKHSTPLDTAKSYINTLGLNDEQKQEAVEIVKKLLDGDRTVCGDNSKTYHDILTSTAPNAKNLKANVIKYILAKYTTGIKGYMGKVGAYTQSADHDTQYLSPHKDDFVTVDGIIVPSASTISSDSIMWNSVYLSEFGNYIPVLNADTEDMEILADKKSDFYERAKAVKRIKSQLGEAGLGQLKMLDLMSKFAKSDKVNATMSPIIVPATENFINGGEGEEVDVLALSPNDPKKGTRIVLDVDFITHFYKVLSPITAAKVYINKSNLAYRANLSEDICVYNAETYKADLETKKHPCFYIYVPNPQIRFTKAKDESGLGMLMPLLGGKTHLVGATIFQHKCILVLKGKYGKALFNI